MSRPDVGMILAKCFPHLREWTSTNGTYEGLLWPERCNGPKPTLAELHAAWDAYVPQPELTIHEEVANLKARIAELESKYRSL